MANKRITDVDFVDSFSGDESFFINRNSTIRQIERQNVVEFLAESLPNAGLQIKHIATTAMLSIDGWINNLQTVNVDGVTKDNTVIVFPHPDNNETYIDNKILCIEQNNGILTFSCKEVPTIELKVNIIIF